MSKELKMKIDLSGLKESLINYVVPLVALILTLLIGFFVLYPSYKGLPELQATLEQKTALHNNLSSKLNNLNKLVDYRSAVEENSDLVNRVLVSEQMVPGLLTQVDRIVRESGLEITRLNYGTGTSTITDKTDYEFVSVNLGAKGNYEQLRNFLVNIENAARIINVETLRYSLAEDETGPFLGLNFVLVSPYYFIESNAITDEPIALDISEEKFINLINKIKNMRYYDPEDINPEVPVIEEPVEEEIPEETPVSEEPLPEEPVSEEPPASENEDRDSIFN